MDTKFLRLFLITLIFSLLEVSNSQNIEEITKPKCNGKKIEYSLYAKFDEYLKNENNIDGRDIYKNLDDLKGKNIGMLEEGIKEISIDTNSFSKIQPLSYDSAAILNKLNTHELDGIIIYNSIAEDFQMFSKEASNWISLGKEELKFIINKKKTELKTQLNDFISSGNLLINEYKKKWRLISLEDRYLNLNNLKGANGRIKVAYRENLYPFVYKDSVNGDIIGIEINFIYDFAEKYDYAIELVGPLTTYEELTSSVSEGEADIGVGFIRENKDFSSIIDFTNTFHTENINVVVRYENLEDSIGFKNVYDSIEDFKETKLGLLEGSMFYDLTSKITTDENIIRQPSISDLYTELLLENIDGFYVDEMLAQYYKNLIPQRITFIDPNLEKDKNAFAFQKNDEGKKLAEEFNEFLKTAKVDKLLRKWKASSTADLTVDQNINFPEGKTLKVAFNLGNKVLSFKEHGEIKGLEIELIYEFLKEKKYNVIFEEISFEDMVEYIKTGKADITGGCLSITEERENHVLFSDPIYTTKTVFATRTNKLKSSLGIEIVDNKYNSKSKNAVDVQVKFGKTIKTSSCVFPEKFNESILINCTISNLKDIEPSEGFDYVKTEDKIKIEFLTLEADNFFQANTKLKNHNDIITGGNFENIECKTTSSLFHYITILAALSSIGAIIALLYFCHL